MMSSGPCFARNVDSFPFPQISHARFCPLLTKVILIFFEFRNDLCYKIGHIECPAFAAPGMNVPVKHRPFMTLFILFSQAPNVVTEIFAKYIYCVLLLCIWCHTCMLRKICSGL
uniref:Predicted protein n=1 Tax=Hordeum vulgare subsp. vulgare TaxID=112509 RepID=F2E2V4_HORVV|nr:predicted protein [Hordeum vulgare subsp. vulgare]